MAKGGNRKVECANPECGRFHYETLAQLRDFPRLECCGQPMRVPDPEAYALSYEGQAAGLAEALHVAGERLEREAEAYRVLSYPQLRCCSCGCPQTAEHSAQLIDAYRKLYGEGYHGDELMLTVDTGVDNYAADPCKCGGDRFRPMPKRNGRNKAQEVEAMPF